MTDNTSTLSGFKGALLKTLLGEDDFQKISKVYALASEIEGKALAANVTSKEVTEQVATPPTEVMQDAHPPKVESATVEDDSEEEGPFMHDVTVEQFTAMLDDRISKLLSAQAQPVTSKEFNDGMVVVSTTFKAMTDHLELLTIRIKELEDGKPDGPHIASQAQSNIVGVGVTAPAREVDSLTNFWRHGTSSNGK